MIHYVLWPVCSNQTDAGRWVTVEFDSQCKILWGETRVRVVPIYEEKNKVQNKNLRYYSHPYNMLGWRGVNYTLQKWPVDGSF